MISTKIKICPALDYITLIKEGIDGLFRVFKRYRRER